MLIRSIPLFSLVLPIICWDIDGHRAVAKIAGGMLSRKAARFITGHINGREDGVRQLTRIQHAIVSVAGWADYVAISDPSMKWSTNLHFSHTPKKDCQPFDMSRDCPDDKCVVTAIPNYTQRASDLHIEKGQRAEAIKFLVHLMADIHSPMHVAFEEDHGGNGITVVLPSGSRETLHQVWDSHLYPEDMTALKANNQPVVVLPDMASIDFSSRIASETATEYTCGYGYKHEDGSWITKENNILKQDYISNRTDIVRIQLSKSAARLAELLEFTAKEYYRKEREASVGKAIPEGSIVIKSNRFEVFEDDWLEEHVFELEDPMQEPESAPGEADAGFTVGTTPSVDELDQETPQSVPSKSKKPSKSMRRKQNKLVLIKRNNLSKDPCQI
jgi:hypothetical protein